MDNALIGKPIHHALVLRLEFTAFDGQLVGYVPIGTGPEVPLHLPAGHCFVVRYDSVRRMPVLYIERDDAGT